MTLEQLRIFVAVAEREHMTRAAESLGRVQSAVSAAIAALEERYGTPLFHRIGRRIELTDAGRLFLGEAKAVMARAAAAELALADIGRDAGFGANRSRNSARSGNPPARIELCVDQPCQFGLVAAIIGERQQLDGQLACALVAHAAVQGLEGACIGWAWEQQRRENRGLEPILGTYFVRSSAVTSR